MMHPTKQRVRLLCEMRQDTLKKNTQERIRKTEQGCQGTSGEIIEIRPDFTEKMRK